MKDINKPLVSVIVITYNSSVYVKETLESVKAQTWRPIELIVSDDCSSDNTVEVCTEWMEKNREHFFETKIITVKKNTGTSANCNRGIRVATGDWFKLIGGDDILMDNCITDNMDYVTRFPDASFIISDLQEIDDDSKLISSSCRNKERIMFILNRKSAKKQLKEYTRWPVFLNTPTFFYKKEMVNTVGYLDENYKIYEDTCMIFRITESGTKMHFLNKPTVQYRIHEKSISRTKNELINNRRDEEALDIFRRYRKKNLNVFNPIDLSIYYETWLRYKFKGINGRKGLALLHKLSLFQWYLRFNGVKRYS